MIDKDKIAHTSESRVLQFKSNNYLLTDSCIHSFDKQMIADCHFQQNLYPMNIPHRTHLGARIFSN